ncbi:MAG TPA: signal peptide peptidase SppA [Chthoniobacteraceae bacterium]|jgi:protease-4|nr:signal peptide peptidase SppA [Chthoniobacteraceae bacterium]
MNKKQFGCLLAFLIILLCGSLLCNFALVAGRIARSGGGFEHKAPRFDEETVQDGKGPDKIVQITLRGVISSSAAGEVGESMVDDLKIQLHQAATDKNVKAIVLYIDSPGGEVTASDMIYEAVTAARQQKPVIVYMGSLAASGGYYVSCGGSYLMADDTSLTGSIGVIIETFNFQDLLGKIGVVPIIFKSGQFKDMLSGMSTMTPEENAYVQNIVMQTYGKFVGIVARERHLPEDQLRKGIADGRVITGRDALQDKLIDGLGQIEDAYDMARQKGNAPGAEVVRYKSSFRFGRLIRLLTGRSESSKVELELPGATMPRLEAGRLYLLPDFFAQ